MKYLTIAVVGILFGAAGAAAVLYYNPLTGGRPPPAASADKSLHYELPADALRFVTGERVTLPQWPKDDEGLWEETIDRSALLAIVLHDDTGEPTAIATRLIVASTDTDLLLKGALVSDYWLLTLPGEGSLFLRDDANLWPFLKDTLVPVWYLGRTWQGPTDFVPTAGPGPDGTGLALGGTGRFATPSATAVEHYRLTALDRSSEHVVAAGELELRGLEPVVAAGD